MADQQAWTIGAASECDIVVDLPTVSGRHCRLTRLDDEFLIEDLGSTNGTFVNGTRISVPLTVTSADDVKLGPDARFPWEMVDPQLSNRQIIRIGRSADNDVVLDYPNVSNHHARIILEGDGATIEDLGSTNGVAIGKQGHLVQKGAIKDSDTVYFGSLRVSAADLMDLDRVPSAVDSATHPGGSAGSLPAARTIALALAALVVLGVVVGSAARLINGGGSRIEELPADTTATDQADESEQPAEEVKTAIARQPPEAVYAVLVQNEGVDQLLHVGTAWGVNEHQLVTSGVVARYLEKYARDIAAVQVRCAALEKVFVVTRSDVHPEFKRAEAAVAAPVELAKQKRAQLEKLQDAAEPPGQKEVDALVNQLIEAEEKLYLAGERMVFHDAGLLTVDETLPFILRRSDPDRKLPVETKLTVYGVPFNPDSMASLGPRPAEKLEGRLVKLVRPPESADRSLRRLQVSSPAEHVQQNWQGSPVLDGEGRVVGVYVRPTPPVDPAKPISGESYDAVLIEQIDGLPLTDDKDSGG